MAVEVERESSLSFGTPTPLFQGTYTSPVGGWAFLNTWDISPDGKRFLMIKPTTSIEDTPRQINVVLNWFEELKELVPVP